MKSRLLKHSLIYYFFIPKVVGLEISRLINIFSSDDISHLPLRYLIHLLMTNRNLRWDMCCFNYFTTHQRMFLKGFPVEEQELFGEYSEAGKKKTCRVSVPAIIFVCLSSMFERLVKDQGSEVKRRKDQKDADVYSGRMALVFIHSKLIVPFLAVFDQ